MIDWVSGEPSEIQPGMLLHYEHGGVELIGTLFVLSTSPVRRYAIALPVFWLEWAESMANHPGHQK